MAAVGVVVVVADDDDVNNAKKGEKEVASSQQQQQPSIVVLPVSAAGTLYYSARRVEDADWYERVVSCAPPNKLALLLLVDCTNLVVDDGGKVEEEKVFYAWNNLTCSLVALPRRVYDLPALDFGESVVVGKDAVEAWLRNSPPRPPRFIDYCCCRWRRRNDASTTASSLPPPRQQHEAVTTLATIQAHFAPPPLGCTMRKAQCDQSGYTPPAVPAVVEVEVAATAIMQEDEKEGSAPPHAVTL